MKTLRLYVDVTYDEAVTDEDTVIEDVQLLLDNALSTPNILDRSGNPEVDGFHALDEGESHDQGDS